MDTNIKLSEKLAILATLNPASVAPSTVLTSWVLANNFHSILAVLQAGVLGSSATLNASLQQAQDSSGTNAKAVGAHAITAITSNNVQALLECRTDELDSANGFIYVALSVTVGVAASLIGATLIGGNPRSFSSAGLDQAGVVQIV